MRISDGKILVIDDEPQLRRFLRVTLASQGYEVCEAINGADGLTQIAMQNPDVVLLDLGLPDIDGLEVLRRAREWSDIPIIVVSAREQEGDKIKSLDEGADDYLTKPFGSGELLARIRVALRHRDLKKQGNLETHFMTEGLLVDFARRAVSVEGKEVHLTPLEYKLLTMLIKNAGKVITHSQLLREVWGPNASGQTHYLRIYMAQLRHKLEKDPARPKFFRNEPGIGYRFTPEESNP
ncbi:MAG TPA: response regulator [Syntrophales bacterium]|nr:response regulator [Syntrophales bacterium]